MCRWELPSILLPRTRVNKLLDDVPTSLSDHHHRAWCVPNDRVRDASHQSPPYPPAPPAAHHDQTNPYILGYVDDLPCYLSHHKMALCYSPTGRPYSFHFPVEHLPGVALEILLQDSFRHLYPLRVGSFWVKQSYQGDVKDVDEVHFGVGFLS